jgi:hypothetical protein
MVYYETDSSSPSMSSSSDSYVAYKRHERKKYSKMPLCYPRISKHIPLLFVPLGKPPYFDGEDYCMWICRRFDPRGSLDRRVNLSLRVLAQMGWREMEHKGENVSRVIPRQWVCS